MDPAKRVLKEAESLSRFTNQDQSLAVGPGTVPDFFKHPEFLEKQNSIPDKMAFKIGDVADILGVKQYVLRYWETEFDELKPKKGANNQRMYSKRNIEMAIMIQHLLHIERFSIEGARNFMKKRREDRRQMQNRDMNSKKMQILETCAVEIQKEIYSFRLKLDSYFRLDV